VVADRLNVMERRLERVEQAPPSPRPTAAAPPIDQKVLEAVIGAVDARLHEHAGQVDRRFADVEARLAVMQQEDRQVGEQLRQEASALRSGMEQELRQVRENASRAVAGQTAAVADFAALRRQHEQQIAEVRREYRQEVANLRGELGQSVVATVAALQSGMEQELRQVRESVSRAVAGQTASAADLAALRRQHEQQIAEMRREYRDDVANLRGEMEQSIETRVVTAVAAAAAAQLDQQLAPLRAEVQQKEKELAELRRRLAESEKSVLDVVLAIGDVCRQAAEHIGGARETRPAIPPPAAAVLEVRAKAEEAVPAPADPAPIATPAPAIETPPVPQAVADPTLARSIPDFPHEGNRRTNWRIPLVSSLLISTGYLALMHYLSASLQ